MHLLDFHVSMQFFRFSGFFFVIAIVAVQAELLDDWQLASNPLEPDVSSDMDWTTTDPDSLAQANLNAFQPSDTTTSNLDIGLSEYETSGELLAGVPQRDDLCLWNVPSTGSKHRARNSDTMCAPSAHPPEDFSKLITEPKLLAIPTEFDLVNCPSDSLMPKLWFVCSAQHASFNRQATLTSWNLYRSKHSMATLSLSLPLSSRGNARRGSKASFAIVCISVVI